MVVRRQNALKTKKGAARGIDGTARKTVGGNWKKAAREKIPSGHPFSCVRCIRTFSSEAALVKHIHEEHPSSRT
jgi:hypothetical protein